MIAPGLLPQVFGLFWQVPGLGIALVKSLVELHGGRVAACSDGAGAEILVHLPARARGA